jgi:exodeoxyribonuclease III
MKIATFNINGITSRLPALIKWLEREAPDVACLQELKTPDSRFPAGALRDAGYRALWHGQSAWNGVAILSRGAEPVEVRRGLPGDPDDLHSRYLEAAIDGLLICCVYLPNGNPQPGPKFDYKLAWFERLIRHARGLYRSGHPVVLAGDFNVVPRESRGLDAAAGAGLDGQPAPHPSGGTGVHLLGLLPQSLAAQCRAADRSSAVERRARAAAEGCGSGYVGTR